MNLRCTFALPLAAFALPPAQAAAAEGSAEVAFGQGTLLVPVPDGFADPSAAPPSAFDAIQRGLPEGARLMAVIIDDGFLARIAAGEHAHLPRYFIVHTGRGLAPGRRKGPAGAACLGASAGQVERGGPPGAPAPRRRCQLAPDLRSDRGVAPLNAQCTGLLIRRPMRSPATGCPTNPKSLFR